MTDKAAAASKGLANVVVGQSKLSLVNGAEGKLIYRGYKIEDLAEHASFEEVIYLLWQGALPTQFQLVTLTKALQGEASLPDGVIEIMKRFPHSATPMSV
ncbi:partial 2-methylcitrate synthase 1, partial [Anaerolineae bacterium]